MNASSEPANVLLNALRDHEIPIKRAEASSAFNDEKETAENAKWMMDYLNHDTLLSREELDLYSKLESTGTLRDIACHPDADASRPFLDKDIRKVIDSLNASTAVIQKQTELLTFLYDNMNKQLDRVGERGLRRDRDIERLHQRHESKRQNSNAASSDLAHKISADLRIKSENAAVDGRRILSSLTAWLKEDDRILADLERLASGIKSTSDDASIVKRTSELSTTLAQCLAEEIHCRLDRVYLENLRAGQVSATGDPNGTVDEILVALRGELESLYPEIDVLAEMSTKQQFSEPILRELQNHHGQLRVASHKKLDYVLDTVTELTSSMGRLTKSLQDRESFCGTLEALDATYRTKVGDQFSDMSVSRQETFRRRSTPPTLILNPSAKSMGSLSESQALATTLRRTGLTFESVFHSEVGDGDVSALFEKKEHMMECLHGYSIAADSPLVAEMISSDRATRLVSSSLNADSHFWASLTKGIHEEKLSELGLQLGYIQKGIETLDLDVLHQRDRNQEKFMEKWG